MTLCLLLINRIRSVADSNLGNILQTWERIMSATAMKTISMRMKKIYIIQKLVRDFGNNRSILYQFNELPKDTLLLLYTQPQKYNNN